MLVTFRRPSPNILNYVDEIWELHNQEIDPVSIRKLTKQLKSNDNHIIFKAKQPVGIFAYQMDREHLHLDLILLKKGAQHQGIGKLVINFLERKAIQANKSKIHLFVLKKNEKAIQAYQKYGFHIRKQKGRYWVMEKLLRS